MNQYSQVNEDYHQIPSNDFYRIYIILINFQMSTAFYNQKWEQAITNLLDNIDEQNFPLEENKNDKGITYKRNDLEWFQYYANLYIRYLQTYRDLEDSYDQMIHPQKRTLMREMLENVIIRMCEVKQNLIRYSTHTNIVQSDYINIDEILMDLKLTPKSLKVPLPRYFTDQKGIRDQVNEAIIREVGVTEETQVIADTVALDTNLETAIRIIQKLERGRQGIVRGLLIAKNKTKSLKDRSLEQNNQEDQRTIIIQKYWRAFLARKELSQIREDQLKFLGIKKDPIPKILIEEAEKQRQKLKIQQADREKKFQSEKQHIKTQIKKTEEPSIKQHMLDERRKWIKKFLQMHEFSNVPNKAADFYKQKQEGPPQQQKSKDNKKDKKDQTKGKGKKNEVQKFLEDHTAIGPTESVVKLQQTIKSYSQTWGTRDETEVSQQIYDTDLARDELRPDIELQLQKIVDGIINLELDGMRVKYGIKKKKEKKPRKKNKKQKKIKIPQGLGKKDPKELLEQLYEKNIAKLLAPAKFDDFIGEHNTITYLVEKNAELLPDPSLSQIRNIVAEYVGIPLGSTAAKEKLQKWSWFLFYGAMGTGKTMLVRALQKETNSIVFDLTPQYVKEKYSEKSELTKLIWSVIICAKQYQPSIIMIDDFQTIFSAGKSKKKDGGPSFGPKMKKIITDLKKNKLWDKNDRISVIGCSNLPYEGSLKEMKKMFDKKIYFPYPNYATRKQIIKHFIETKAQQQINYFPYETFAHISEGFTAGSFKQCVEKVLTPLRISRLKDQPLRMSEFINPLSNSICVFSGEYQKLRKFTDEVTGLKERREAKKEPAAEDKKKDKKPVKK